MIQDEINPPLEEHSENECDECNAKFQNSNEIREHYKQKHAGTPTVSTVPTVQGHQTRDRSPNKEDETNRKLSRRDFMKGKPLKGL